MQNMASGLAAENSILVLQAHHVDIVEVQEFSRFLIRGQGVLSKRPSYPPRIVVPFIGVVDRECQQSSIPVLCGDCAAQVGGERSESTLPRKIISDNGDSTGQRWLRMRSHTSSRGLLLHERAGTNHFQGKIWKHCNGYRHFPFAE